MREASTVELHHVLEGPEDAPVLVMANSLGTTLHMWDEQASALRDRFRVLRYDHRGHGGSPVPPGPYAIEDLGRDALALLDALGVERFSWCGLSIGGMVGMWLASEAPERVESLVLCCTSALLGPRELWDERIRVAREEGMDALMESVVARWFTPDFFSREPEKVEKASRMLRETNPEGYAGCCAAIREMDLRERLGGIRAPTLVLSAAEDPATSPEHGELIRGLRGGRERFPSREHGAPRGREPGDPGPPGIRRQARAMTSGDPTHERGMEVRREVLGDEHVDAAIQRTTGFTADFQDLITRYAWGEIWTRPGLDRRTRSCITLTALVALGRLEELELHVRAALRNGLSEEEIKEVLLHAAIYCGVPAANAAFAVAQRVLADR
jgi:3-oxoadipate enol-lactonase/4-carboxymuconolactone decarboxylase